MTIDEIITHFQSVKQTSSGYKALCPVHGDHDPSLCIGIGHNDRILISCKSHHCNVTDIMAAVGLTIKDLFNSPASYSKWQRTQPPETKPPIIYKYPDYDGTLLYEVLRLFPKDFRQRIPDSTSKTGYKWGLHGQPRVLYHLPELKSAIDEGVTVVLCEGEKDTDNVVEHLKLTSTTGGGTTWTDLFTTQITGAHVVMLPDNDEPGRTFMAGVAQRIHGVVASLRIVQLPNLPHKGDVTDWINAGGTIEQFDKLVAQTPFYVHDETVDLIDISKTVSTELPDGTSRMDLCMQAIMAYVEPDNTTLELKTAAEQFYENYQLIDDYEIECMKIQLNKQRINPSIVVTLINLGEPKEPVPRLTVSQILAMSFEPREELPLFGIPGADAFIRDVAACLTASPSAGKTEMLSRSARYWNCPVLFISEEPVRTWFDRLTNMEIANLPDNPLLEILPASGRGHSFVLDTIRSAQRGTVVIVDSARDFSGVITEADGPEWVAAIDPWIRAADKQGVTLIVLHHDKKGSSGNAIDAASGSNALMSRFGQRIHLKASGEDNQFLKVEGIARAGTVKKTYWQWLGGTIVQDDRGIDHHLKTDSVSSLLLDILDPMRPQTVSALQSELATRGKKTSIDNTRKELLKLKEKGQAVNTCKGNSNAAEWVKIMSLDSIE